MLRIAFQSRPPIPAPRFALQQVAGFKWIPPKETKRSVNLRRSNRAKEGDFNLFASGSNALLLIVLIGLYHGLDIRFGNSISFSHKKHKRCWKPNVQKKRLFSYALDDWVGFNATTTAIKAIDDYGGLDNYILKLDERLVEPSKYVTKVRLQIATALFHKGELDPKLIKKFGFHKSPPPALETTEIKIATSA